MEPITVTNEISAAVEGTRRNEFVDDFVNIVGALITDYENSRFVNLK